MTVAALLMLGITSAQVNPEQPQQPEPGASNNVMVETKKQADPTIDVPIDPNTIEEKNHNVINDGEGLKNELKTKDHIKSTSQPPNIEKPEAKRKKKVRASTKKQ